MRGRASTLTVSVRGKGKQLRPSTRVQAPTSGHGRWHILGLKPRQALVKASSTHADAPASFALCVPAP